MNTKILLTIILTGFLSACSKNAYNTKPTLKLTSVNTNVVPFNGTLVVTMQVTDKEGDVTDTLFVKKVRINKRTTVTIRDSFALKIPNAPNSPDGTIEVNLSYQNFLVSASSPIENDTLLFKFALKDKGKNISDTVTTDPIVIIRQ
jgi:hypothetical protein